MLELNVISQDSVQAARTAELYRYVEGLKSHKQLKIFAGNANPALAWSICRSLGIRPGRIRVGRFADGEIDVQIQENVRGSDCYVLQPTCPPVNENIMELLIILDALRRASAGRVTAVIPYFGYARADRKSVPRVPISSKLVANLITAAGATRVITMDLHAAQIQGFFDIPVDHLYAAPILLDYFRKKKLPNAVVVSPDVGGVERARAFAKRLNTQLVIIDKRRPRPNEASIYHVIGNVKGKNAIILDDMVDTAGTITKVAAKISAEGALRIWAASAHGVLSGPAMDLIEKSEISELVLTDSIPTPKRAAASRKVKILSIAQLLGEAIVRNHQGKSISALFI